MQTPGAHQAGCFVMGVPMISVFRIVAGARLQGMGHQPAAQLCGGLIRRELGGPVAGMECEVEGGGEAGTAQNEQTQKQRGKSSPAMHTHSCHPSVNPKYEIQ
jgi:hypothetical protein